MDSSPRRRHREDNISSPAKRRNLSSCTATGAVLSSCSTNGTTNSSDVDLHDRTADAIVPVPLLSRFDDITDDTLLEIFLRLPAKTLHRVKCISKRWLSLISAPSFARSYIVLHPVNILFFKIVCYERGAVGQVFGVPALHDDMNEVSSSISGSLPPISSDFVPALQPGRYNYHSGFSPKGVTERLLVDVFFMGDSAGLILLKGVYQDRTDAIRYYDNKQYYIYYVCNPITKQWVKLPSISTPDIVGLTCYYLQLEDERGEKITRIWGNTSTPGDIIKQSASYNPNEIEYTVVSINKDEVYNVFIIRVFSSTQETLEWRIFCVPIPHGFKWRGTDGLHRVLFSNGKFHWTGETCIAAYDPFNKPHQCDIIPLPPMDFPYIDDTYLFTTYEGRIRLGTPFYTRRCSVWELADYANKLWVKKYEVNVDPLLPADLQCFVLGSAGEKAYMVSDEPKDAIMIFDMRNASLQHVYTYPSCPDNNYRGNQFFMWCLDSYVSSPWPTPVPPLPPCERGHKLQQVSV